MEKKKYIAPRIEWIQLDNEISLALESYPPAGPDEIVQVLENDSNPFKSYSV